MSSAPWEEIIIGTVDYAQEGASLEHWKEDPEDAWHETLQSGSLCFSLEDDSFSSCCPTEKYIRADIVAALRARVEELEGQLSECVRHIRHTTRDIWQTARANQMNLNGKDPAFPDDPPCELAIGRTTIDQSGIDESLRVMNEAKKCEHETHKATYIARLTDKG